MHAYEKRTSTEIPVDLHEAEKPWTAGSTTGASWLNYTATSPWTTPGGDFAAAPAASNPRVGATTGWYFWTLPTALVQRWLESASSNDGVLAKGPGAEAANHLSFSSRDRDSANAPYLEVVYEPRIGKAAQYTLESHQITSRTKTHVNVGNGNRIVEERDAPSPAPASTWRSSASTTTCPGRRAS